MLFYAGLAILVIAALAVWRGIYLLNKFTFRDPEKLLAKAKEYNEKGISVLINIAAEGCRDEEESITLVNDYLLILDLLTEAGIDGHLSIKPSSFVPSVWPQDMKIAKFSCILFTIVWHAHKNYRGVWLDEERFSDEEWVEPVKRSMVLGHKFTNLSWRIRCYRKNASERVNEYLDWHRQGARFGLGLCRGAYAADRELDDEKTERQIYHLAITITSAGIDCAFASHTVLASLGLSQHMLHGRREVEEILDTEDFVKEITDKRAVYMIYGRDLRSLLPYVWRRLREKPELILCSG